MAGAGSGPAAADDSVLAALRLGWALAETRGRLSAGPPAEQGGIGRDGHALPLGGERSWLEQTIETQRVLCGMAADLEVDFPMASLSYRAAQSTAACCSARLKEVSIALARAREDRAADMTRERWVEASKFFYAWDAQIQDALAAKSFAVASGYQLGRALAEITWALDGAAEGAQNRQSYDFLLGDERVAAIDLLATRLSANFDPLTVPAILASVRAWACLAQLKPEVRARPATLAALHAQCRIWHDLLLTGQPPRSLVTHRDLLTRSRRVWPVVRVFLPEVCFGLLGLAAAALAVALFLTHGADKAFAGVLAVLGVFGVTASSSAARAKNQATALFAEFKTAFDLDLVKEGVTVEPARAYVDTSSTSTLRQSARRMRAEGRTRSRRFVAEVEHRPEPAQPETPPESAQLAPE